MKNNAYTPIPTRLWRLFRLGLHVLRATVYIHLYFDRLDFNARAQYITHWSRHLLKVLGVTPTVQDTHNNLALTQHAVFIANHISWLDVFVMYHASFAYFIAKAEVRHWPIIGWLTRKSGAIFIDREKRRDTAKINTHINRLLTDGARVALFPEGTTSAGLSVQTFYASLLQPAIDAQANVIPITLRYLNSVGEISTHASYTGNTSFLRSAWQLVSHPKTTVVMVVGEAICCGNMNRKALSLQVHTHISTTLKKLDQSQAGC
jgi:1-acyl-sn-glycerol-3-phosphate acyltransferase